MIWRAIVLCGVAAAGCAGELENPARFTDCPPGAVEQMFQAKCGGVGANACHGSSMPDANLDLVSPNVGDRVRTLTSTSMCDGRKLVGEVGGTHLMVEKVEDSPACGSRMPFGQQTLSVNEVECVRRWVEEIAEAP